MRVMTSDEVEERFGITAEQLDEWERDAAASILHGAPRADVTIGRPQSFEDHARQVGLCEPIP